MSGPARPAPAVQLLGDAVLLRGPAVIDAWYLLRLGIRETQRRDGITPGPRLRELLDALEHAAAQVRGVSARPDEDVPDQREHRSSREPIGSKEAAVLLDRSPRQVRRLARTLDARRAPGGAWTFDRQVVTEYVTNTTKESA